MPIKPENKRLYPDNWADISRAIRGAAGNCCEGCGVPNRQTILRGQGDDHGYWMVDDGSHSVHCATKKARVRCAFPYDFDGKPVTIILTVAHLDHDPSNNDRGNLKALCQRCHLDHDRDLHRINAAATRRARKASADLFGGAP
jgi:hypothetical protein